MEAKMNPIVSPTTTERIVRTLVITGMVGVFSIWFLYDGFVNWPQSNLEKAVQSLQPAPETLPEINASVTVDLAESLEAERRRKHATGERLTRGDIDGRFGKAGWNGLRQGITESRYFGPGGTLVIQFNGDLVHGVSFEKGSRDEAELFVQKVLGFGLLPVTLLMLGQVVRVVSTRAILDQHGLKLRGRRPISIESMRSLDATDFERKGIIDLRYETAGRERVLRLDSYVYRDLRALVSGICDRCGFSNPFAASGESIHVADPKRDDKLLTGQP